MNSKNILTIVGAISVLQGLAFYFGAEMITQQAYAVLDGNALFVGTTLHQAMGAMIAGIGVIALFSRNINAADAKKVLNGVAVALIIILLGAIVHLMTPGLTPPIPVLVLFAVLIALSLYTANKKD
jgi:CHASE2 domain-containing sensor protein